MSGGPVPFTISGDQFLCDGSPVFLNIICYQPLMPGQVIGDPIDANRIEDDLRRWKAYRGGSDPVVIRVYPQPPDEATSGMPRAFYDGVRELGFWIIRDIYFDDNYTKVDAIADGQSKIRAVLNEVVREGGQDRILAWELGNEFSPYSPVRLVEFVLAMSTYIKEQVAADPNLQSDSNWVTWARDPRCDPLYTHPEGYGARLDEPWDDSNYLDYYSTNAYSERPARIREHQMGPGTGTPFAGYLAGLRAHLPNMPRVVTETGLADSPSAASEDEHQKVHPWYPAYRYGGLSGEQVAEGLLDRYWDARLSGSVAGVAIFEWNDEWWKSPRDDPNDPCEHDDHPEEYFGLLGWDDPPVLEEARFKLQQETVRDLFAMRFPSEGIEVGLAASEPNVLAGGSITIEASVSGATPPVRLRWETDRGRIVGDSNTVSFYASDWALGHATVTAIAADGLGRAKAGSVQVLVQSAADPNEADPNVPILQLLAFGRGRFEDEDPNAGRASGRVANVDPNEHKVILYIETNALYVQPRGNMTSIWIGPDGYWWSPINLQSPYEGQLVAWLVPIDFEPSNEDLGWSPPNAVAGDRLPEYNDWDNDLLPDDWEADPNFWTPDPNLWDRYDDPDGDLANNLEEFLAGTHPNEPDNDGDPNGPDGLPDNWEYRYLGTLSYDPNDDPDDDGLDNQTELSLGTHAGRTSIDADRDGLPDSWEFRVFGSTVLDPGDTVPWDPNGPTVRDAYELGLVFIATLSLDIVTDPWGGVVLDPEPIVSGTDVPGPNEYTYREGTSVSLSAEPTAGKSFRHWVIYDANYPGDANYATIDSNSQTTVFINADPELTAAFKCGSGVGRILGVVLCVLGLLVWGGRRQ